MRKTFLILFAFTSCLAYSGCDTFDFIPLAGNSDTLVINLPSGTLSVYLKVWQGHVLDFCQTYDTKSEVSLFPDSLEVTYKGRRYPCSFVNEGDAKFLQITGLRKVRTSFTIDDRLNKGDTILVFSSGYLYSGNQRVDLKRLTLVLSKDIRGPMGS